MKKKRKKNEKMELNTHKKKEEGKLSDKMRGRKGKRGVRV